MASEVLVPRLGWSMEEGIFNEWLKDEGEAVEVGDNLFVLEGEKAIQDIESFDAGILRRLPNGPAPGDVVQVGQLLGYLVAGDEIPPFEEAGFVVPAPAPPAAAPEPSPKPPVITKPKTPGAGRIAISPRARRLAEQMSVDWTVIAGTGRDGRVREIDIRSAAEPRPDQQTQGPGQVVTVGPIRKAIARRLGKASQETVPVTLFRSVRAEALVALRAAEGVSYSDILVNLVAACLRDHPVMNSTWTSEGIWYPDDVNISLAVDTDAGLLAPVILQADRLSLAEISATSSSLAEKAQAGQLRQSDLQGGTFTISNLGMHGVEHFTPILNPPQCSTLGVGTITPEPVCEGEDIIAGLLLHLSLTFDHRIVDGAPAARFLEDICQRILQV